MNLLEFLHFHNLDITITILKQWDNEFVFNVGVNKLSEGKIMGIACNNTDLGAAFNGLCRNIIRAKSLYVERESGRFIPISVPPLSLHCENYWEKGALGTVVIEGGRLKIQ